MSHKKKPSYKNVPSFDLDKYAYQLTDGIDLMEIAGVGYNLILTLAAEVGFDLAHSFPRAKNFTSWMGLSPPNKRITGGIVLSSKSNRNKSRLAQAF